MAGRSLENLAKRYSGVGGASMPGGPGKGPGGPGPRRGGPGPGPRGMAFGKPKNTKRTMLRILSLKTYLNPISP